MIPILEVECTDEVFDPNLSPSSLTGFPQKKIKA